MVFSDEASFRQTPTLHATWARRGSQPQIPTLGQRHTQKVFGAVSVPQGRLVWRHQTEYFHWESYLGFVEGEILTRLYRRGHRVFLIQDNASYHKKREVYEWFGKQRRYLEVFQLPPYSPELNAQERVWRYTRARATHNQFFQIPEQLTNALLKTFEHAQAHPREIAALIQSFS